MRTHLRKIGNSRGVIIPAALLKECGIDDELELSLEEGALVIKPIKPKREGWFDGYSESQDDNVWQELTPAADSDEWEW